MGTHRKGLLSAVAFQTILLVSDPANAVFKPPDFAGMEKPDREPQEVMSATGTAWGKAEGSLQAGLCFDQRKASYQLGDSVPLIFKVRNVGDKEIILSYIDPAGGAWHPEVVDATGNSVSQFSLMINDTCQMATWTLEAGAVFDLARPTFTVRSAGQEGLSKETTVCARPGKHRVSYTLFFSVMSREPWTGALTTGQLPLELLDKTPKQRSPSARDRGAVRDASAAESESAMAWGEEVDGVRLGATTNSDAYRRGEPVEIRYMLINAGDWPIRLVGPRSLILTGFAGAEGESTRIIMADRKEIPLSNQAASLENGIDVPAGKLFEAVFEDYFDSRVPGEYRVILMADVVREASPGQGLAAMSGEFPIVVASAGPTPLPRQTQRRNWGPEQATGPPDTHQAGDIRTAWASLTQNDRDEWLVLEYAEFVVAVSVKIYETYNPGAVSKVSIFSRAGKEIEVWTGKDPTAPASGMGVSEIQFSKRLTTNRVKIYLDSKSVPGWNEIDAVGLVDVSGKIHWAVAATASSTFAER